MEREIIKVEIGLEAKRKTFNFEECINSSKQMMAAALIKLLHCKAKQVYVGLKTIFNEICKNEVWLS